SQTYYNAFVTMAPIHACNLQCKYCFARQGKNYKSEETTMPKKSLLKSLEYIYFDYFKDISDFRFDFVSGGEPLLNFETIKSVVEICEMFRKGGKTTKFWLCTNGTINQKEIFSFLDKHGFNIGISLDGTKKDNDNFRVFQDGTSSYQLVVNTLNKVLTESNYTRNFKNVWGLVVITSETQSLVEIIKHLKQIGLKRVQMRIVRTVETYGLNEFTFPSYKSLFKELFTFFIDQFINGNIDYIEMMSNDNDYLGKIMRRIILRRIVANRCQAGKNKVSLTANGQLFPCDSFVGKNQFCIGDALKRERYDGVLEKIYVGNIDECSVCWARYICGGDCYHNSFLIKQDVKGIDSIFCKLQKYLIEQTVAMYCQMNDMNVALFGRLTRKIQIGTREGIN
ncbi:MAG: SPASM domain-containing protein, partial [Lachnospiraceae bacterium]|nr:SPASM domain-containing protein [Lachnospiraceae bacterium]